MRLLVAILFLMFVNAQAFAFSVPIHPAQCYPDDTGGATKAGPEEPDGSSNEPTVRIDFPDGSTTTALCSFIYPNGAPYTLACTGSGTPFGCCTGSELGCQAILDFDMVRYSSTSLGDVVWNVDVGCNKNTGSSAEGLIAYAGTSNVTDSSIDGSPSPYENVFDDIALSSDIQKPHTGAQCMIRIKRIGGDAADTNTGTATFDGGVLRIYPEN